MDKLKLNIGGIYSVKWDTRPIRVLLYDKIETHYDCYWPEINKWTFLGNWKKKLSFYRIPTDFFIKTSTQIDILPFSDEDKKLVRPDLPIRFCRIKNFNFDEYDTFIENLNIYDNDFDKMIGNKIALYPSTKNGSTRYENIVEIESIKNLFIEAKRLQETANNLKFNGIGFYRLGITKGLPSYYIGEYINLAKINKE